MLEMVSTLCRSAEEASSRSRAAALARAVRSPWKSTAGSAWNADESLQAAQAAARLRSLSFRSEFGHKVAELAGCACARILNDPVIAYRPTNAT